MNRGGVGARTLNLELQAAMNPVGERKVERFGWTFAPGDKVMQVENDCDREVYDGDIGFAEGVDSEAGDLTARFDGRSVTYGCGVIRPPSWCRPTPFGHRCR
jgi:exodeoxyribonuclease V alpha subunit